MLLGGAAAHPDHDRASQDRVGEFAEPGERDRRESGKLHHDLLGALADAPVSDARAAVPGVEQAAQFLVFFGLGAEDGVDLVKQDGAAGGGVRDGAKQRGGGGVDRVHRPRHQQGQDFEGTGFPRAGLRAEERQPGCGVEGVQHVGVPGPQRGGGVGLLGGQGAEPADERAHVVQGGGAVPAGGLHAAAPAALRIPASIPARITARIRSGLSLVCATSAPSNSA